MERRLGWVSVQVLSRSQEWGQCCTFNLKEHMAHRGTNEKNCPSVPPNVKTYFQCDLNNTKEKKKEMIQQRLRIDAVTRTHYSELIMVKIYMKKHKREIKNKKEPSIKKGSKHPIPLLNVQKSTNQ
jgi:hypothetical protein